MYFQLDNYDAQDIVKKIAEKLEVESQTNCLEEYIDLPRRYGSGKISGFNFSDGIYLLLFNTTLKNEWKLNFVSSELSPLFISLLKEGAFYHSINKNNISYNLASSQIAISSARKEYTELVRLSSPNDFIHVFIFIDREAYFQKMECYIEQIPIDFQRVLKDIQGENLFLYQGSYSYKLMECIQDVVENQDKDIIRSSFIEGKTLELISLSINKHRSDQENTQKGIVLNSQDLQKIIRAKDILLTNLASPPTILELSKQVGINQSKLKKGFKDVFETTIKGYVIEKRLEKAHKMLLSKDLSISDIAYKVGYSNNSHFSRLFKKKYGVLPKDLYRTIYSKF